MNPTRLTATNYRTFESLDLDLPVGCVAIVGENGAGKSSIVNLIELALFGGRLADHATDDSDGDLVVGLEFEHRGESYRIRRSLTRGKSPKVDFEKHLGENPDGYVRDGDPSFARLDEWHPLTKETVKETDAAIVQLLGLSRETFRASAFLAQGDGAAFTEAQPRERKAILAEILGLDVWDALLARTRFDKTNAEAAVSGLQGRIELAESQLSERASIIAERDSAAMSRSLAETKLTEAKTELEQAQAALTTARESERAVTAAGQVLSEKSRRLTEAETRAEQMAATIRGIEADLADRDELTAVAARATALEESLATARQTEKIEAERSRLVTERGVLVNKIALIENEPETRCPTCEQHMNAEAKAKALTNLRNEKLKVDARIEELPAVVAVQPVGNIEHDLAVARDAGTKLIRLEERQRQGQEIAQQALALSGELPAMRQERIEAQVALDECGDQPDTRALQLAVDAQRQREVDAAEAFNRHDHAVTRADTRLEQLAKVETELKDDIDTLEQHRAELDLLAILERAFGRDGVPALIVENAAIPQIELEANRILDELGTSFRVELRTQRALKSGDGVKEALDIVVLGPGGERLYESFSGGEKTRLNLALRIALARLLAHRRGAEVRLLAIDEPEFLDEAGHERLAGVLRGLLDDFDRVLLVSHAQTLKDAFDQVIQVEKGDDGRSRIASGAPSEYAEAVSA